MAVLPRSRTFITLCHTCHHGLQPHNELVPVRRRLNKGEYVAEILSGMKRYQKLVKGAYETSTTTETTSKRRPRKADSNQ